MAIIYNSQQAKRQYGFHRENMLIDADNRLVLAIEAYAKADIKVNDLANTSPDTNTDASNPPSSPPEKNKL